MNDFIETTEVFLRNLNESMIERDQFNDCLEILLDKVMDYQTSVRVESKALGQIISLTETLLRSSTNRQAIDEDTIMVYEQRRLKTFKNKFWKGLRIKMKGKNNSFKLRDTRSDIAEVCTILGLVESLTFYVIKNEESVINDPNLLKQLTIINNAVGDSSELLYTLLGQVDIHSDILDHTGKFMTNNKSYYAIIPANVRYDKKLTANAKLLYGEITALCNEKGFCWAGDKYFADLYGVSKSSIQNWLKSLYDSGYITRDIVYKDGTREILHRYIKLFVQPTQENLNTPIQKNLRDNNTLINTTVNNTNNNVSTRKKRVYADDDPNKKLAVLLLKSVRKNQNIKAPDLDKWANTIRLVIEADKRSGKEVQEMIIWAAQHDFWSGVVLSPSSLRKNWDKIAAQKNKKANSDNWQLPDYSIDPKDEDSESDSQKWPDYRIDNSEKEPTSDRDSMMTIDEFPY